MSERKIFISKRCDHCIRLIVGLSKHDLLKYFDVINIDTQGNIPPFVRAVPTLFHNGKIVSGENLFDYMNEFAKKIMTVNEKKQNNDDELEAWCPNGSCSIGFSEISENDDNFKDTFHKDLGSSYETLSFESQKPSQMRNEDSNSEDRRVDDFNKKYEEFMNSRN